MLRHVTERCRLPRHHVRVEIGWPAHGLTCVVDDEVETIARLEHLSTERLNTRRVTQVEPEDLEAIAPLLEVRLVGVSRRRIAWEPSGHDEPRTAAQELQAGLIADLDATTGQQRDASAKVGQLGALREVRCCTFRAELIVEIVDGRVLLLADITVLKLPAFGSRLWALGFRDGDVVDVV